MNAGEGEVTLCPWCGTAVPVHRQPFPGPGQESLFLRCPCGAIGLPTLEPKSDRLTVPRNSSGCREGCGWNWRGAWRKSSGERWSAGAVSTSWKNLSLVQKSGWRLYGVAGGESNQYLIS